MILAKALTQHGEAGALLEDVCFEIRAGEIYCLIANPTSVEAAMEIIAGLRHAANGECTIAGHDVMTNQRLARQYATIITRHAGLYGSQTVRDNVRFLVTSFGGRKPTAAEIDNALRRMGIPERDFGRSVSAVPIDVATRVWLAIALLRGTPAVVLDEPSRGLDARASNELREAVGELGSASRAVLVATSDIEFGADVADRLGVIKHGTKITEKTRAELSGDRLTQFYLEHAGRLPRRSHHGTPRI